MLVKKWVGRITILPDQLPLYTKNEQKTIINQEAFNTQKLADYQMQQLENQMDRARAFLNLFLMDDIAYGLLLNEDYPGWLAEVKLGATTVWERWNSLLPDGTISGISMNSMNHYSYGAIAEWMFRHVAGINTMDSAPGLRRVSLQPTLNWELGMASASYDSACGEYRCAWKLTDPNHVELKVSVPFGGMAELHLPYAPESVMREKENPMFRDVRDGVCILEAGDYSVAYELTQTLKKEYNMDSTWQELFSNPEIARYLTEELDMNIPQQYLNRSVRELASSFASEAANGKLERLERFLNSI